MPWPVGRKRPELAAHNRQRKVTKATRAKMSASQKTRHAVARNSGVEHNPIGAMSKKAQQLRNERIATWHRKHREESLSGAAHARTESRWFDTKPEQIVAGVLESMGLEYRKQLRMGELGVPASQHAWDFVLGDVKVLVEVDGCYWHGCTLHCKPRPEQKRIDRMLARIARVHGWYVVRIWEHTTKRPKRAEAQLRRALGRFGIQWVA